MSAVPTAEDLAADQAAIDLDQVNVQIAQQDLVAATLTSPLAGTVAAVSITAGSTVSANLSTAVISVLAPGSYFVSATVPLADVDKIKVGEPAGVRPDVATDELTGTVASIGVLTSAASTTSGTAFPVTVAVQSPNALLYDGSGAGVTISVGKVDGVLAVPSSAVHTEGSRSSVVVQDNGTQQTVPVTIGVVGQSLTEITSGLTAGQTVVLADLTAPIPTSTAATRAGAGFGAGGGGLGAGVAGGVGGAGAGRGIGGGAARGGG